MRREIAVASVSLLCFTLALAGSQEPTEPVTALPGRPLIELRVSAHHGMLPMELTLTGEIKLPGPDAMKACFVQADWTNTTGTGLPFTTRDMIPCVKPPAEIPVPESFEQTLSLEKAGTYSYRIILEDREGKRYASASREVEVKESPVQIKATRDGSGR